VVQQTKVDLIVVGTIATAIPTSGKFVVTVPSDVTMYSSGFTCSAKS